MVGAADRRRGTEESGEVIEALKHGADTQETPGGADETRRSCAGAAAMVRPARRTSSVHLLTSSPTRPRFFTLGSREGVAAIARLIERNSCVITMAGNWA